MTPHYTIAHTEASLGWGGQEMRIFLEMRAMRARGHRLLLWAPEHSRIYAQAREAGLTVYPLETKRWKLPVTVAWMARVLREGRVQVMNMHSSLDGWIGGLAARKAGTPLIVRSRHIEVDYPSRWRSRIAFGKLPHHVLTTSRRIAERMSAELGLDPARITNLPTGLEIEKFDPSQTGTLHQELGLDLQTPLIGMVSVLRSWKGHPFFLEAARQLVQRGSPAHFIIAGDGPQKENIEALIDECRLQGKVHLVGHRTDVPTVLASLTVLAAPSTAHEGVPQIVLQAQAMRTVVVAAAAGGIPEVVCDGGTGLLVPPQDATALAGAWERVLGDAELRERLVTQARAQVEREHTVAGMCGQLETLYARYLAPGD